MVEIAVVDIHNYPVAMMVDKLITEVIYFPEKMPDIRQEYMQRSFDLTRQEWQRGAKEYLNAVLTALYDGNADMRRSEMARLAIGGEVSRVMLQPEERLNIIMQLLDVFKRKYGEIPYAEFKGVVPQIKGGV